MLTWRPPIHKSLILKVGVHVGKLVAVQAGKLCKGAACDKVAYLIGQFAQLAEHDTDHWLLGLHVIADNGIDEIELQMVPPQPAPGAAARTTAAKILPGGVLASAIPHAQPCNDYDPMWLVYAHPSAFPHGVGKCPQGMSLEHWARCIILRHPRGQYACNLGLLVDMFNIIQRHNVNTHARVQLRLTPRLANTIGDLSSADLKLLLDIMSKPGGGIGNSSKWRKLSPSARTLLQGMKRASSRVAASPGAMLSLRSRVLAISSIFGPFTCMINLNPSELNLHWTFTLAGVPYTFDAAGRPQGRPGQLDALRIVAANPVACAQSIQAYLSAFCDVFLGWPMESKRQSNPDCLFGVIKAAYLKFESSGRGGLHAHGQILQPPLQAQKLQQLMKDGHVMQKRVFEFMESFCTSYLPWPGQKVQGEQQSRDSSSSPNYSRGGANLCAYSLLWFSKSAVPYWLSCRLP